MTWNMVSEDLSWIWSLTNIQSQRCHCLQTKSKSLLLGSIDILKVTWWFRSIFYYWHDDFFVVKWSSEILTATWHSSMWEMVIEKKPFHSMFLPVSCFKSSYLFDVKNILMILSVFQLVNWCTSTKDLLERYVLSIVTVHYRLWHHVVLIAFFTCTT